MQACATNHQPRLPVERFSSPHLSPPRGCSARGAGAVDVLSPPGARGAAEPDSAPIGSKAPPSPAPLALRFTRRRAKRGILAPLSMDDSDARRLHSSILRAVRSACPSWLRGDAEDLAQAATLKVLERFGSHETAMAELAMSYLWRTAHSVVVDEIRRRGRRPEVPAEDATMRRNPAGAHQGPEAAVAMSRLSAAVRGCLGRLANARRRAVSLYLLGYGVVEIAGLSNWGAKRSENLVYRGLADLRTCLRSKGYGHDG